MSILACSRQRSLLEPFYLPIGYKNSVVFDKTRMGADTIFIKWLNPDDSLNRDVLDLWKERRFQHIFQGIHPFYLIVEEDIDALYEALNRKFDIFYFSGDLDQKTTFSELRTRINGSFGCLPLSNLEIRFLMNSKNNRVFSMHSLSMLMISLHELMLKYEAIPVYPNIYSTYLKGKYESESIKSLQEFNLFSSVKLIEIQKGPLEGFVVCRKRYSF
ncbi:MAG: hypothetical protein OEY59_03915 [Deltaproteobacteria bacterium]|nr:hypothetical protein [Deltaproteobacteria bacterium]